MVRSAEHTRTERAAFAAFLDACPRFEAEVQEWSQPEDEYPDIEVRLKGGRSLEFELGEWLHESQMNSAKRRESLEAHLLAALDPLGRNPTANVRFVLVEPMEPAPRFENRDREQFRSELLGLIAAVDSRYEEQRSWGARYYYSQRDFRGYPLLAKYLRTVLFDWRQVNGELKDGYPDAAPWIDAAPTGGSYNPNTALEALQRIIDSKIVKYGRLPEGSRLLVHYGKGWVYNAPFHGLRIRSFGDVARWAAEQLAGRSIQFERIYLVDVLEEPGPNAFEIYPRLVPGAEVSV